MPARPKKPAKPRAKRPAPAKEPRIRRTAEDARTAIMDATEQRLVERGPNGIRLQDVAADVGVSHPTILHHFLSRERLVEAVIQRRVRAMNQEVILSLLSASQGEATTAVALFERLHQMFGPGGHARVVAWCALEGRIPTAQPESIKPIAQVTHAARLARRRPGQAPPDPEETEHVVHLAALALFAEAIVGWLFRGDPEDRRDEAASQRFRDWLARHTLATLEA
jgi:AcrR family transcriptional regulator